MYASITLEEWSYRFCHIIDTEAKYFELEHFVLKQLDRFSICPNNNNNSNDTDMETVSRSGTLFAVTDDDVCWDD